MPFFEDLALQMGSQAGGAILGMALGGVNDKRQINQQRKLQELQIRGQKDLSDYNYAKQLQMWEATNYGPQVEQMKKAGLNPALMYGMGGGGGTSIGNAGPGVSGGNAPVGGREIQDMMGMGMQLQIMKAQKENIEADTANKQAENPNIPKAGAKLEAETADLLQGIKNKEAQEILTKTQNRLSTAEANIRESTQNDAIEIMDWTAAKALEELHQASNQTFISQATKNNIIDTVKANLVGALLRNNEINKEIQVKDETIKKIRADIQQGWTKLGIDEKNMIIKAWETEINASQPGLWNVIGGLLKSAISQMDEITKPGTIEGRYKNPVNR